MLIDGQSVGLGTLLEPVPVPDTAITLNFARPDNGKQMLALTLPWNTTIAKTKAAVAEATGLRLGSMVLARGKSACARLRRASTSMYASLHCAVACLSHTLPHDLIPVSFAVGSRISDSSENLFADDQTLWACGYIDQQVPGMMYLGEATDELNDDAKSGALAVTL